MGSRRQRCVWALSLALGLGAGLPRVELARAQGEAPSTADRGTAAETTVEEEAVFDEGTAPAATAVDTVEEEAVFDDEAAAAPAPAAGTQVEEVAVFDEAAAGASVGPNAGFPEHDPQPWLLILPALGLALIAGQVRWRGASEEKR